MPAWYQYITWRTLQNTSCILLRKKYNVETIEYDTEPKPPFILISNHAHVADPFVLGSRVKYPIHYMANEGSVNPAIRIAGKLMGTYPKKKGMPDRGAVMKTIDLLKNGHVTGLFVEGDRSWDGETSYITPNIVKLIKGTGVPLRMVRLTGNYLSMPRWAKYPRKGKFIVEFDSISAGELSSMSDDAVYQKIKKYLYRNDIKDPRMREIEFTGEAAAGNVEFLIWLCPECHGHDSIKGEGGTIKCGSCGRSWTLDCNLRIDPHFKGIEDLKDWSDYQLREIKNICGNNGDALFTDTEKLTVNKVDGYKSEFISRGSIKLFKERTILQLDGGNDIVMKTGDIKYYIDNFNKSFQFSHSGERYEILFNGQNASKYIFFWKYLQGLK